MKRFFLYHESIFGFCMYVIVLPKVRARNSENDTEKHSYLHESSIKVTSKDKGDIYVMCFCLDNTIAYCDY